jgi:hypothetical protein
MKNKTHTTNEPAISSNGVLPAVYYYISTKWTNKNDGFITLWRKHSNGYCWYKNWAQIYDETHEPDADIKAVPATIIDNLWVKVNYDGEEREVLLNVPKTLKALGLKRGNFIKNHASNCPGINDINRILVK